MKSDLIELELIFQTETPLAACFHEEEAQAGPLFGSRGSLGTAAPTALRLRSARGKATKPRDVWLPLSKIEIEGARKRGAVVKVTLPERLAIEKGLI